MNNLVVNSSVNSSVDSIENFYIFIKFRGRTRVSHGCIRNDLTTWFCPILFLLNFNGARLGSHTVVSEMISPLGLAPVLFLLNFKRAESGSHTVVSEMISPLGSALSLQ